MNYRRRPRTKRMGQHTRMMTASTWMIPAFCVFTSSAIGELICSVVSLAGVDVPASFGASRMMKSHQSPAAEIARPGAINLTPNSRFWRWNQLSRAHL